MPVEISRMCNCASTSSNHSRRWDVQNMGSYRETEFWYSKFMTLEDTIVASPKIIQKKWVANYELSEQQHIIVFLLVEANQ
ncbi:hypothetical protein T11_10652 [Trichinella zimbabwensis]|uniref:Uncharacterized protein n=1 Tax=Trichinella zimbabwensis TaxID=268475 RepID=A0A0V1GYE6_9BILA|nr:hypothetical protein T11_6785 [Trichinella zimbabwensis]KRZ02804.1 hypothetical protein T11_10652 [Trichinella zimbabwensis]